MTNEHKRRYEYAQDMGEKLYDYLSEKGIKCTKLYVATYEIYSGLSDRGELNIKLVNYKATNNSITFNTYIDDDVKYPYRLCLRKYKGAKSNIDEEEGDIGDHIFKDYDLKEIKESDFPQYLEWIRDFYNLYENNDKGFISLF